MSFQKSHQTKVIKRSIYFFFFFLSPSLCLSLSLWIGHTIVNNASHMSFARTWTVVPPIPYCLFINLQRSRDGETEWGWRLYLFWHWSLSGLRPFPHGKISWTQTHLYPFAEGRREVQASLHPEARDAGPVALGGVRGWSSCLPGLRPERAVG